MFQKGRKKTGGRKKGTKNKRTLLVEEIVQEKGLCLVTRLLELAEDNKTPINIKAGVFRDLLEYIYPKKKAVELSGEVEHKLTFTEWLDNLDDA